MEWFVLSASVPVPVEYPAAGGLGFALAVIVGLVPLALLVRQALRDESPRPAVRKLQLVEGVKELSRRAA